MAKRCARRRKRSRGNQGLRYKKGIRLERSGDAGGGRCTLFCADLLEGQKAEGEDAGDDAGLKTYDVATNDVSLSVTEQGEGPAVLFCHGFPDTSYTWRRQMKAIASAGYRAIAPDMRGYGRSSAPADANLYTPLQTAGDLVGLLDALKISTADLVGHDWGASHAWNAALMRPIDSQRCSA